MSVRHCYLLCQVDAEMQISDNTCVPPGGGVFIARFCLFVGGIWDEKKAIEFPGHTKQALNNGIPFR